MEVGKIRPQLVGRELAFINNDGVRQRAYIKSPARFGYCVRCSLAQREHATLEVIFVVRLGGVHDERLADERFAAAGYLTDLIVAHRYRSPAQHLKISSRGAII